MALRTHITDFGSSNAAKVTTAGQLVVGAVDYDDTKFVVLDVDDTAYNFFAPKPGKSFVITLIRLKADRDVSNTVDAVVIVYEAGSDSTTVVDKILHQDALIRAESVTLPGLNIKVTEGKWVNAKTSDEDIHTTIMGYYVDV